MNILNRSAITVRAKRSFIDWANALTTEYPMDIDILGESHTYLTTPDFEDAAKHLKEYFKILFDEELEAIWTDENDWPQKRDFTTFCYWFHFEISDWVQDLSNSKEVLHSDFENVKNNFQNSKESTNYDENKKEYYLPHIVYEVTALNTAMPVFEINEFDPSEFIDSDNVLSGDKEIIELNIGDLIEFKFNE
jgi:hypothetical protein